MTEERRKTPLTVMTQSSAFKSVALLLILCIWTCVSAAPSCSIADYGAKNDCETDSTFAVLQAIEACSTTQGTVVIPKGCYKSRPFNLTSGITLFVASDAKLVASDDFTAFPLVEPLPSYGQGREGGYLRYAPFVGCYNCKSVSIRGNGTIDGSGQAWWNAHHKHELTAARPHLLEIAYSTDVVVTDVTFVNPPFWNLHLYSSENILVQRVKTRAPLTSPNTDGIDPDSCVNVLIEDCDIESGDDGISIKSGMDAFGRAYARPSANITIRNTRIGPSLGLAIGSEMSGNVYDVSVEHIRFEFAAYAIRFKSGRGRGGFVKNVVARNLTLDGVGSAIFVNEYYAHAPGPLSPVETPQIFGVLIESMHGIAATAGEFNCLPEAPCHDFVLRDITVVAPEGFKCEYAHGSYTKVEPRPCLLSD